jgi:hypothetical protein
MIKCLIKNEQALSLLPKMDPAVSWPILSNQIPIDLGGQPILNRLRKNYGATNTSALLQALSSLRESDVNKYFSEFHRLNAQMHILVSKFSPDFLYSTLKNRFDQPPFKDVVREFGRRAFRNDEIDEMFIADFVESLKFEASQLREKPMEANFVKRKKYVDQLDCSRKQLTVSHWLQSNDSNDARTSSKV